MPKKDDAGSGSGSTETGGIDWQAEVDKYKALARKEEEKAKASYAELERLKASQDGSKSEMDKLRESVEALTKRAEQAELSALKAQVASDKGLSAKQASRLQGSDRAELESDADDLIATFGIAKDDGKGDGKGEGDDKGDGGKPDQGSAGNGRGRPQELRPGASPGSNDDAFDPGKLAESILEG